MIVGVVGCLLCAMVGSMTYPGIGALIGAASGLAVFTCFGCLIFGTWRDCVPQVGVDAFVPSAVARSFGAHGEFSLILTVHRIEGLQVIGRLFGKPDTYVVVQCGHNPRKNTCVKPNNIFEEQFKLNVKATDKVINLFILDQDFFGSTNVARVSVDIQDDIINEGFPTEKAFSLTKSANDKLRDHSAKLVLSFDPGDGEQGLHNEIQRTYPDQAEQRSIRITSAKEAWKKTSFSSRYGTTQSGTLPKDQQLLA